MTESGAGGTPPPIGDDLLHAYVDGRLDLSQRGHVEAWLHKDAEAAARVADWQAQNAVLRAAFEPVAAEPVPSGLLAAASAPARVPRRRALQVAAAVALLAIGGAGGFFAAGELERTVPPSARVDARYLAAEAAAAHRVFSVEVRHPVEVGADQEAHLVQWLGKRVGTKLVAPRLDDKGFRLIGGRLLSCGDGPAAQLMYENRAGKRLTAYVAASVADGQTAFQFRQNEGVSTFYWIDSGTGYALSGDIEREPLLDLARAMYTQLQP